MIYGIYGNNSTTNRPDSTFNSGNGGQPDTGGTETPGSVARTDGVGATGTDIAGTITDNVGVLALEEGSCTEILTTD
jgi:hypothetical protein